MAKQRLSKLQSWILKTAYLNAQAVDGNKFFGLRKVDIYRFFKNTFTFGNTEIPIEKNFKAFLTPQEYNKINATISRTIRSLRDKSLVKLIGHEKRKEFNLEAVNADMGNLSKEEYLEKHKNQSPDELMKNFSKWEKTQDVVVEIKENSKNNVKVLELTTEGIKKAQEIVNVKL